MSVLCIVKLNYLCASLEHILELDLINPPTVCLKVRRMTTLPRGVEKNWEHTDTHTHTNEAVES